MACLQRLRLRDLQIRLRLQTLLLRQTIRQIQQTFRLRYQPCYPIQLHRRNQTPLLRKKV
ncbi:hypothetical protein D3C87_1842950 [compost metagenome]